MEHVYNDPPHVEPTPRWVRVKFGGEWIADSRRALLNIAYGRGKLPTYYFPREDVRMEALQDGHTEDGRVTWTVKVGEKEAADAAWSYVAPSPELADLQDYVTFKWHKMDAWYEEEEKVFVHARDPYKRVDVMASSRHVRVEVDGVTVAESKRPYLLFETNLPVRYYLPPEDVEMSYLEEARGTTQCPYKGVASYWSVKVGDNVHRNLVWSYPDPIPENPKIEGLMCFYNEKVDIYVDGELQERPQTHWS